MKLTKENLYIKEHGSEAVSNRFVICIELPDNSRNYLHSQPMALEEANSTLEEIMDMDIPNEIAVFTIEDSKYFRVKMEIEPDRLSRDTPVLFHSRKLNLNDAVRERQMLLE